RQLRSCHRRRGARAHPRRRVRGARAGPRPPSGGRAGGDRSPVVAGTRLLGAVGRVPPAERWPRPHLSGRCAAAPASRRRPGAVAPTPRPRAALAVLVAALRARARARPRAAGAALPPLPGVGPDAASGAARRAGRRGPARLSLAGAAPAAQRLLALLLPRRRGGGPDS